METNAHSTMRFDVAEIIGDLGEWAGFATDKGIQAELKVYSSNLAC